MDITGYIGTTLASSRLIFNATDELFVADVVFKLIKDGYTL